MDIAFVINPLALEGLGATLVSLLRHCADSQQLQLWFLCSDFPAADRQNLDALLRQERFGGRAHYLSFDARQAFGHLSSLHGDWTSYGKLLLPSILPVDRVLYLDADLLVREDVLQLRGFDFGGHFLAAVPGSPVASALDHAFFMQELGWPADRRYFNSGVMLLDLARWRALDLDRRWQQLAQAHGPRLTSHDQTLFNALAGGTVAPLPPRFNNPWYPGVAQPAVAGPAILHFVGSPKPWDCFGRVIHAGHGPWRAHTPEFWYRHYHALTSKKVRRTWQIKKSIAKHSWRWWQNRTVPST